MKINNLVSTDYQLNFDHLKIYFQEPIESVLNLDSSIIEVRTDEGDLVETLVGWTKQSAAKDFVNDLVVLTLVTGTDGAVLDAMAKIKEQNDQIDSQLAEIDEAICTLYELNM